MKNLFYDNRIARLLQLFQKTPVLGVGTLAAKLEVSERTVRNDIRQLNQILKGCAVIDGEQGMYTLRIFNLKEFRVIYSEQMDDSYFLNSPGNRIHYLFGRLMRTEEPVLTDDIADEMSIGRTTLIGDLKRLRSEMEPYRLSVIGRVGKGLSLRGSEQDIRQYVLDHCYENIYEEYPLDQEITDLIQEVFREHRMERSVQDSFERFATLMLDRFLTGHYIGELTEKHYQLKTRTAFRIVDEIADGIERILHIEIPTEERIFLYLPIAGMRTPADIEGMESIRLDENVRILMEKILTEIGERMDILIQSGEFTEEFLYHLMFMMNRLRFGVKLHNPILDDIKEKYPLAYQMAEIASEVIEKELDQEVNEDECGYLASYFGVFLTENEIKKERPYKVAVVCGTGRVTARLVGAQVRKVMDRTTQTQLFSVEKITKEMLEEHDLILTTVRIPVECAKPVIHISEVFNETELLRKIEKVKYWQQADLPMLDNNWFVMGGLLDETRFFYMDLRESETYEDAVTYMVMHLQNSGQVDEGFLDRLAEREKKGTMVFGSSIALPHAIQYAGDKLVLAVGILAKEIMHSDQSVRIIFLLGLPEQEEADDGMLIRTYDEIIYIAQDKEMLEKLASCQTFHELQKTLYRPL